MLKLLSTYILTIFMLGTAFGQIADEQIDNSQYPANNRPDTKREAIFNTYFEEANVSNMHFYTPTEETGTDYFFEGKELPRGLYGIFAEGWREDMPADFKAYAVYSIRGDGKPFYVLRFSGEDVDPTIGLFEMAANKLHHKATLATYWCGESYCLQKDSWIQDFDGDTRLDILIKVKMTDDRRKKQVIEEYYSILQQADTGNFKPNSKMDVNVNDYFMEEVVEK